MKSNNAMSSSAQCLVGETKDVAVAAAADLVSVAARVTRGDIMVDVAEVVAVAAALGRVAMTLAVVAAEYFPALASCNITCVDSIFDMVCHCCHLKQLNQSTKFFLKYSSLNLPLIFDA